MDTNSQMKKILETAYPNARVGFIEVIVDALDLHARKNHDYNGASSVQIYNKFEAFSKLNDVRRKYSRLYHLMAEEEKMKVDERLEDTAIDLGVYAFLLTEYIRGLNK